MKSLQSLNNARQGASATLGKMRSALAALNSTIERLEGDSSRSREYIAEGVKAERDKVLPVLAKLLTSLRETAANVAPDKEFWSDRRLLLSRQPFVAGDAAEDALVRAAVAANLARLDQVLLTATAKNALLDGDLPLLHECSIAGNVIGAAVVDLSQVEIPDQAEALAAIRFVVEQAVAEGEHIAGGATGLSMDPVRKLALGRAMQPA